MKLLFRSLLLVLTFMCLAACSDRKPSRAWLNEDDVQVAVDETFAPIMQDMINSFGLMHKEATMKPVFCSEDSALRLLVNDSLRCCIATRRLSENEKKIVQGHTLGVKEALIATDAIAIIVNKNTPDSLITVDDLRSIVSGKITRWEQLSHPTRSGELKLVFDHSGSSTVRFMKDSLNAGANLSGNVFASEEGTNLSVIDMVKNSEGIIGVVGTNWLKTDQDSVLTSFRSLDVRVMKVARTAAKDANYVRPFQYYIATADYPLLRSVYVITTDPRVQSMVKNFYFFMKGQKGQTILCNNSQLLPYSPVQVKSVNMQ